MANHFEEMAKTMEHIAGQTSDPEAAKTILSGGHIADGLALACMAAHRGIAGTVAALANQLVEVEATAAFMLDRQGVRIVDQQQVRQRLQDHFALVIQAVEAEILPAIAAHSEWQLHQEPKTPRDGDDS